MSRVKASFKTSQKLPSGSSRRLSRDMLVLNIIWASCITRVKAFGKTSQKLHGGSSRRLSKDMLMLKTILV